MTATSPTATSAIDAGHGAGSVGAALWRQETGMMSDKKNTRGIRRTVTVLVIVALLVYLGFMWQTAISQ